MRTRPLAIAPGQKPAGIRRQSLRHRVVARGAEGVAAQDTGKADPAAAPQTKAPDRLAGIVRAGRRIAAGAPEDKRQGVAVDPDQNQAQTGRKAGYIPGKRRLRVILRRMTGTHGATTALRRRPLSASPRSDPARRPRHRRSARWRRAGPCIPAPAPGTSAPRTGLRVPDRFP